MRKRYPTDLTDKEWQILEALVPPTKSGGRPANYTRREILNGILYVLRSGCQWRMLPHDLPNWQTVYTYYRNWRLDGSWKRIHDALRKELREEEGRQPEASAGILDSQSVKTTEKGGRAATMRARKSVAESDIYS
jgi:putative transposase